MIERFYGSIEGDVDTLLATGVTESTSNNWSIIPTLSTPTRDKVSLQFNALVPTYCYLAQYLLQCIVLLKIRSYLQCSSASQIAPNKIRVQSVTSHSLHDIGLTYFFDASIHTYQPYYLAVLFYPLGLKALQPPNPTGH